MNHGYKKTKTGGRWQAGKGYCGQGYKQKPGRGGGYILRRHPYECTIEEFLNYAIFSI